MPEPIALVFRNGHTKIDDIQLDVTITEQHHNEVEVTEHPVEEGAKITDHARTKPDSLTITGLITNTPVTVSQKRRIVDANGVNFETVNERDQIQGKAGYAETAYRKLLDLEKSPRLITVFTHIHVYQNMIMSSLDVPRDKNTGDAVIFTASFKEVRVVKNKVTKKTVAKEPKAQAKAFAGVKPTGEANAGTKKKSIAYKFAESFNLLDKMGIR